MISGYAFGDCAAGRVTRFRLENRSGAYADILSLGCTVQALAVPDKAGRLTDVALGYDCAKDYISRSPYMGAVCARVANRIGGARFTLGADEYALVKNDGENCLHGGGRAFSFGIWDAGTQGDALILSRVSPDGEYGFPGELELSVTYRMTDDNALTIEYEAQSAADTPVNPTNHTYFCLDGQKNVSKTRLMLESDEYLETDSALIPTGRRIPVEGTEFDFKEARDIGRTPYDHCFVLRGAGYRRFARAQSPFSGIVMSAFTDRPAVQLYTAASLDEAHGKRGARYGSMSGFCLETQCFTDAVNHAGFPTCILKAGEKFKSRTSYAFDVI